MEVMREIIKHNLDVVTFVAKLAQYPYFSKFDFANWSSLKQQLEDPNGALHWYFADIGLPDVIDDSVVSCFNQLLDNPTLCDELGELGFDRYALIDSSLSGNLGDTLGQLLESTDNLRSGHYRIRR